MDYHQSMIIIRVIIKESWSQKEKPIHQIVIQGVLDNPILQCVAVFVILAKNQDRWTKWIIG